MSVLDAAYRSGVDKIQLLGSSCIYPKLAPQPIKEEYLLTGPLEPTNEWYAIAKIAGIKMAQAYRKQYGLRAISLMPTNLYGPEDNFDLDSAHVLPALIRKVHEAKLREDPTVVIWGTGSPRREFLHVDDMAAAAVYMMQHYDDGEIVNVGAGKDISIRELAEMIAGVVGYRGALSFDTTRPDGTPRNIPGGHSCRRRTRDSSHSWRTKSVGSTRPLSAAQVQASGMSALARTSVSLVMTTMRS